MARKNTTNTLLLEVRMPSLSRMEDCRDKAMYKNMRTTENENY